MITDQPLWRRHVASAKHLIGAAWGCVLITIATVLLLTASMSGCGGACEPGFEPQYREPCNLPDRPCVLPYECVTGGDVPRCLEPCKEDNCPCGFACSSTDPNVAGYCQRQL